MNPSHVSKEQVIDTNIAALGSPCMKTLDRKEIIALGEYLSFPPLLDSSILSFKRVRKNGSVYHSLSYKRVTARNSYTILFEDNDRNFSNMLVGQVHFYFQYKHPCNNSLSCAETCVLSCRKSCVNSSSSKCAWIHNNRGSNYTREWTSIHCHHSTG